MKVVHAAGYHVDIGAHVFPTVKYGLVVRRLLEQGALGPDDVVEPAPAAWPDLALVHTAEYLGKLRTGSLSAEEVAALELPCTAEVIEGFRLMTGGTVEAARLAVADGLAGHAGGGLHHAFANHGEGFCVFNDVAVAIRVLQSDGSIARAAVVDCDVHHGNGTALIFERDPDVFTFSMHQRLNYPIFKPRGSLDVHLDDGTGDAAYLDALAAALPRVVDFGPDLVVYLAGADPFEDDQLGGLALTAGGLRRRDELALGVLREAGVPVAVTLAGGYARRLDDTVDIHVATLEVASSLA